MLDNATNGVDLVLTELPGSDRKRPDKPWDFIHLDTLKLFITDLKTIIKPSGTVIMLCSIQQLSHVMNYLKEAGFIVDQNELLIMKKDLNSKSPVIHGVVSHLTKAFYVHHNTDKKYKQLESPFLPRVQHLDKSPSVSNIITDYLAPSIYLTKDKETQCKSLSRKDLTRKPRTTPLRTNERNADALALLIHRWCPNHGLVFDPFAGTASTAMACLITDRKL